METQLLNSSTDIQIGTIKNFKNSSIMSCEPSNPGNKYDIVGYSHNALLASFRSFSYKDMSNSSMHEIVNEYMLLIEKLSITTSAKRYLKQLGNLLYSTYQKSTPYSTLKDILVNIENDIINDPTLQNGDKRLLLGAFSIARYSTIAHGGTGVPPRLTYADWCDIAGFCSSYGAGDPEWVAWTISAICSENLWLPL